MENQYSDSIINWYDRIMCAGYYNYEANADALSKIIKPRGNLLELGIGTGLLAEKMISKNFNYSGIDFSPAMLKFARMRLNKKVKLYEQDVTILSIPDKFDAAISEGGVWVIRLNKSGRVFLESHIRGEMDNISGLKKVAEHLVSGGLLVLNVVQEHKNLSLTLDEGAIYSQEVNYQFPWFYKKYLVTQDGKVVAEQESKYRIFDNKGLKALMDLAGFAEVGFDKTKSFMIYKKKSERVEM